MIAFPAFAQTEYISNSRDVNSDRIEDLNGDYGLLLLSKNNDLVINVTNAQKKPTINLNGLRSDGYYEYRIVIAASDSKTPKVEVSRRGSVYKTEFVQTVKPDFLIAYRLDEVQNPIRMDNQTKSNDAVLDPSITELEFTTTIKNLKIVCSPQLNAKISSQVSKSDANITITSVIIPVEVLVTAKKTLDDIQNEYNTLNNAIQSDHTKATDVAWSKLDELEKKVNEANNSLKMLATVDISGDGTNHLSIDISELGPRIKKCYAVLPVIIEKKVFVTECSAFVTEGGRLFSLRNYKEARAAYNNALKSKDVVVDMIPIIKESIAQCDSCIEYEGLAALAIQKIVDMKKNNNATQSEIIKYAAAAIEFYQTLNRYKSDDIYKSRIKVLEELVSDMPLKIKFTVVEWKTLQEGNYIPNVEIWAYFGKNAISSTMFPTDKKFQNIIAKESNDFVQVGVSNNIGEVEVDLDRGRLPEGLLFRPTDGRNIKIKYLSLDELFGQSKETIYVEKQFRIKMFVK